jgi:hypothetical protein
MFKRGGVVIVLVAAIACSKGGTEPSGVTRIISLSGDLSFGVVNVGQSANATLTITNTGNSSLTITGMTVPAGSGSVYFASWTSGTISPGGSQQVNIRFTPLATASYSGLLTVNGDQTGGSGIISISGTGLSSAGPPPSGNQSKTFDGTYDFSYVTPDPSGGPIGSCAHCRTISLPKYFKVTSGNISSTDGLLSGTVTDIGIVVVSGTANFKSLCPFGAKDPATWTGTLNALAGPKTGSGTYSCVDSPTYTWQVFNGQ